MASDHKIHSFRNALVIVCHCDNCFQLPLCCCCVMFLYCPIQYSTGLSSALLSEKAIFSSVDVKAALGYLPLGPVFFLHTLLKHDSAHAIHMNRILGVFGMWAWSRWLSVIAPFHWAALTRFLELTGCLSCLGAKCQKMQPVTEFQMASFQTTCSGTMVMSGQ